MKKKGEGYEKELSGIDLMLTQKRYEEALQLLNDLILNLEMEPLLYFKKSEVLFCMGEFLEAENIITGFGQRSENIIYTYFLCSKYFKQKGKMNEATFWWEKYWSQIHGRENYYTDNKFSIISGGKEENFKGDQHDRKNE